ncbi:aminotransferase family protein [Chitinophaga nivalis]|uniref:Aminotransferase class III-fold pyridoxal phosphate-dependent enzyme n=1 Tax=Chitinophaga nivalis TaxID=2991709 RepID=A0ABT3IK80_9BACT|nr:aminotransferase class III-fold pyridoxal phosphate-dependent enzyme [Chitinophaga nivalis]MCW3465947.1 aminotransferase class III-fold pyridoxal phosphate-dependent enzyme [Chitinophaga nivalis]MCW3484362.1 aminotransferase class III-fold pyridoxal phosphate-dependent enzyme [Chitinophaga nivalis]
MKSLIRSAVVCPDATKKYPAIVYGKGIYLYDESGKGYLDASSGSAAVSNLGYGIPEIAEIIREQSLKVSVLPTHVFSSRVVDDYFDALVDFAPPGFSKVWTVTSGTEAVESAIKLALQYHRVKGDEKRYKIVSRHTSYHGNSVFMLDIGGMPIRKKIYDQWMNHFPHISAANTYRKPDHLDEEAYVDMLADEFEQTLLEGDPGTFAAFIAEPVVGAAMGAVPAPPGYLERMYHICRKYGLLFISDEVLAGFGRVGTRFGVEKFNVIPDIIAAGKGISGGYFPLSAVLASREVMEPFVQQNLPFLGGHTYACNPLGAAIGRFVLTYIAEQNLVQKAEIQGRYLKEKLQYLYKHDIVGDVRGEGLLLGIELVQDKVTKKPFPPEMNIAKRIGELAMEEGVVLYPGKGTNDGFTGDHILISPPLIINQEECDQIANVLDLCIEKVVGVPA